MKSMRQSRTIQYQVASAMLTILIGGMAVFKDWLDPQYLALILLGLKVLDAGVNTYLRLITTQPIERE